MPSSGPLYLSRVPTGCARSTIQLSPAFVPIESQRATWTDVGGDPVEQTRWKRQIQTGPAAAQPDERVLTRIERLVFVPEQPAAAPQHHRPVLAAQGVDIRRVSHAAVVTPQRVEPVTADRWGCHDLAAPEQEPHRRPGCGQTLPRRAAIRVLAGKSGNGIMAIAALSCPVMATGMSLCQ
jgi:hypothetical protein